MSMVSYDSRSSVSYHILVGDGWEPQIFGGTQSGSSERLEAADSFTANPGASMVVFGWEQRKSREGHMSATRVIRQRHH